jgi:hypothetical protein
MGILHVTEFSEQHVHGGRQVAQINSGTVDQTPVTFTTTTASAAFAAGTVMVRIHTNAICSIAFGTAPSATTSNFRMAADQTEYFGVPLGAAYKVAAVSNT